MNGKELKDLAENPNPDQQALQRLEAYYLEALRQLTAAHSLNPKLLPTDYRLTTPSALEDLLKKVQGMLTIK